jgi:pilus assembly protein Flp/PilA
MSLLIELLSLLKEKKMNKFMRFLKEEDGVTAIEYGLIASLVAIVIIVAVTNVGNTLDGTFTAVETTINGAGS